MQINYIAVALLLSASVAPLTGQLPQPSLVDPVEHRAEIRATLLKQTPLGSSIADVQRFIRANFAQCISDAATLQSHGAEGEAAASSPNKGVKSLQILLGTYIDNPATIFLTAPLLNEKSVTAQWAFDNNGRLVEIFVDKSTKTY